MSEKTPPTFPGFEPSNTTPVPDVIFDELLPLLSGAELKALLYIVRRTLGFKKTSDAISLNQFLHGIITKDEKVLDKGCGIHDRTTLVKALDSLEKLGCIESVKGKDAQGDNATTLYRIRFRTPSEAKRVVGKTYHPRRGGGSGKNLPPGSGQTRPPRVVGKPDHRSGQTRPPVVGKPDQQETVIQETDSQENVRNDDGTNHTARDTHVHTFLPPDFSEGGDDERNAPTETRLPTLHIADLLPTSPPTTVGVLPAGTPSVLTPEQQQWFETIYCHAKFIVIPPRLENGLPSYIVAFSRCIQTVEQLNSLFDFTQNQPYLVGKVVHPGNLFRCLNDWYQTQLQQPMKGTSLPGAGEEKQAWQEREIDYEATVTLARERRERLRQEKTGAGTI